jgi:hypothetical protein
MRPICRITQTRQRTVPRGRPCEPGNQYICSSCGAERGCKCNAPAVPKYQRAQDAVQANPDKSDRAIAKAIGASPTTVGKARDELSSGGQLKDRPRTGLDGRTRKVPRKKQSKPPKEVIVGVVSIEDELEPHQYREAFLLRAADCIAFAVYKAVAIEFNSRRLARPPVAPVGCQAR